MKTYLGIDFGQSKIGLAKAASEMRIATPLRVIHNDIGELKRIVAAEEIDELVVGYPLTLSGAVGSQARSLRALGRSHGRTTTR